VWQRLNVQSGWQQTPRFASKVKSGVNQMDKHIHKAQAVVDMSEYKPKIGYAAVAQVEAYWNALKGDNLLPKRSEINPRGIERALANTFILERIAPGIARLRIAGNHLNNLMGMEVRGMPLTALFTPNARRTIADLLEDVFQTPATSSLHLASEASAGRPAIEARLVLFPLKSDLSDVSRILGCLVAKGELGLAPRQFDIAQMKTTRIGINASDPIVPDVVPVPAVLAPTPPMVGFAEPKVAFHRKLNAGMPRASVGSRPPYLRLVKTDE
jgi:hypothetical protein